MTDKIQVPELDLSQVAQRARFLKQRGEALITLGQIMLKEAEMLTPSLSFYEQSSKLYVDMSEDVCPTNLQTTTRRSNTEAPKSETSLFLDLLFEEYPDQGFSAKDCMFKLDQNQVPYKESTVRMYLINNARRGILKELENKKYVKVVK